MKLYLDYDSVLNDMTFSWLKWINETFNTTFVQQDVNSWRFYSDLHENNKEYAHVKPYDWFDKGITYSDDPYSCKPFPCSVDFFNFVAERHDTYILTSTYDSEELKAIKNAHIFKHYGTEAVLHEHSKWKYAVGDNGLPNILVDDRLHNCLVWTAKGGISILYNHENKYEYNRMYRNMTGVYQATSYDDVIHLISGIKDGNI